MLLARRLAATWALSPGLLLGQAPLPASGVGVEIPLLAHFAPGDPPDAGVAPDVLVAPRWADAQAGVDTEVAAARTRLAKWRATGSTQAVR